MSDTAAATGYLDGRGHLASKVAAVIGGASGIGEAVTLALAEAGVDITVCDINAGAITGIADAVIARGRRVVARVADVTQPDQITSFYDAADSLGRLDIVVNLAGGTTHRLFMPPRPVGHRYQPQLRLRTALDTAGCQPYPGEQHR